MRIGIGITTKDRPELLKALLDSIYKYTDMSNVLLHIEDDSAERLGVAKRKNNCLRALKDCSHVFLMDDDIEIIKDGWVEFFIHASLATKQEHFLYLTTQHNKYSAMFHNTCLPQIDLYRDCGGVFMFMTKKVVDKVGAFDEKFKFYGFEHCDYSRRILGEHGKYPCLADTKDFIFAHDYSTPNHKSSITDEEKQKCIKNNWDKFFNSKINSVYLPL